MFNFASFLFNSAEIFPFKYAMSHSDEQMYYLWDIWGGGGGGGGVLYSTAENAKYIGAI